MPLGLQQRFLGHPAAHGALDRRPFAGHHPVRDDRSRTRQPRPRARRYFRRDPRLLFQHGLAEIAVRNPDILAEREDFVAGEPFADVFFFFLDPATTEIYTLSLHDALPI